MCAPKHHEDNVGGLWLFVFLVILLILLFREKNERPQPPARHPQRERRRYPLFDFDDIEEENVLRSEYGVPTLDLHQMSVREAIEKTETFLQQSRGRYRKRSPFLETSMFGARTTEPVTTEPVTIGPVTIGPVDN
ncbi:hypothetical protein O3P69_017845 [Scylla paramamosain]|uniref:Uncharacterized protein n=1 Tax=Scylla paramamosain TaxID=85552 RepID=A0AAW0TIW3_SCYPA